MNTESKAIRDNHYKWCKNNGYATSWYRKKPKEFEIKKGTKFGDQINLYFKKRDLLKKQEDSSQSLGRSLDTQI